MEEKETRNASGRARAKDGRFPGGRHGPVRAGPELWSGDGDDGDGDDDERAGPTAVHHGVLIPGDD